VFVVQYLTATVTQCADGTALCVFNAEYFAICVMQFRVPCKILQRIVIMDCCRDVCNCILQKHQLYVLPVPFNFVKTICPPVLSNSKEHIASKIYRPKARMQENVYGGGGGGLHDKKEQNAKWQMAARD